MDDKLKKLRRFSLFFAIQLTLMGFFLVTMGVLFSRDMNGDITIGGLLLGIMAGFAWHAAYLTYDSYREMKNFSDVDSYIKHVESQRKQ